MLQCGQVDLIQKHEGLYYIQFEVCDNVKIDATVTLAFILSVRETVSAIF